MNYSTNDASELENKYINNKNILYRMQARRAKLVGLWAAESMFIFGDKALDYALSVVLADYNLGGGLGIYNKLIDDFATNEIVFDEITFKNIYNNLLFTAHEQIITEQDVYNYAV